jgi:8-oxo-dGTP diphosphatase
MRNAVANMTDAVREFGELAAGAHYVLRPGGYAVVVREPSQVAVVTTPRGWFLPGGALEGDETPSRAAIREARDECGLKIRIVRTIGAADELVYSADEATHFRKRCTFLLARPAAEAAGGGEADHVLCWVSPEQATEGLLHASQRWAVAEACRITRQSGRPSRRVRFL